MGSDSTTADVGQDQTLDEQEPIEARSGGYSPRNESEFVGRMDSTGSRHRAKRSSFLQAVDDIQMDIALRVDSTKGTLRSGFINIERRASIFEEATGLAKVRAALDIVMTSAITDTFLGCIICFDVILAWVELDMNAAGDATPPLVSTLIGACFGIYVTELVINIFTKRSLTFNDPWIHLDVIIVLGGTADYVIQTGSIKIEFVGLVRVFRIFRIVRLLRVLKKFGMLRELKKLVAMSASCAWTLFWSFIFCFVLMLIWGMVTVSIVAPVARELTDAGGYQSCPHCADQMSTVLKATMLYFKLAVVGDQWGMVVEPLMYYDPWTAMVFIGAVLSIVFGILNLIVAVVVDEFAERRANDFMAKAQELDEELVKDEVRLKKIFRMVDENDDGELSLEELVDGAKRVPEFRNRLRAMDIDESDVKQLFAMLDDDHSGTIEPSEFLGTLSRWLHESKTASRFVKYQTEKLMETQGSLKEMMVSLFELLHSKLSELRDTNVKTRSPSNVSAPEENDLFAEVAGPDVPEIPQPIMPTIPDDIGPPSVPRSHDSWSRRRESKDDASLKALQRALRQASEAIAESLQAAQVSFEWKESPPPSGTSNCRSALDSIPGRPELKESPPPFGNSNCRNALDSSLGQPELKASSAPRLDALMAGAPTVHEDSLKAGPPERSHEVQWQELPEDIKSIHVIA